MSSSGPSTSVALAQVQTAGRSLAGTVSCDLLRPPIPTITFDDELVIEAGRHAVELRYHGPNHQDGNIFIHLPAQQVLMLVDVIVPGWVPFHALGGATDVAGYLGAHDAALGYDFATLVAGHLTRTGTMHDVHVARQYLNEVRDDCTRARQAVSPSAIAAAAGEDKWELASSLSTSSPRPQQPS